jgi:hypothetical protein
VRLLGVLPGAIYPEGHPIVENAPSGAGLVVSAPGVGLGLRGGGGVRAPGRAAARRGRRAWRRCPPPCAAPR